MKFKSMSFDNPSDTASNTLRYVAIFQLKDYADLVMKNTEEAFSCLCECTYSLDSILQKTAPYKFETFTLGDYLHTHVFADTITLVTNSNTTLDLLALLTAASHFMTDITGKHVLLSGYVSYGHFFLNESKQIFCGKPYIIALQEANSIQANLVACDTIITQNLDEARHFSKDKALFTKLNTSLIEPWDIPLSGHTLQGGLVQRTANIINWPSFSLDVFETIKSYTLEEFYYPYEKTHGPFSALSSKKQTHIEQTLAYINHSLAKSVELLNSGL